MKLEFLHVGELVVVPQHRIELQVEGKVEGGVGGVGGGEIDMVHERAVALHARLHAEECEPERVGYFAVSDFAVLVVGLGNLEVVALFVGIHEFVLEADGRIEECRIADGRIAEHGVVGVAVLGVVVEAVFAFVAERIPDGLGSERDLGERILLDFVRPVMETR